MDDSDIQSLKKLSKEFRLVSGRLLSTDVDAADENLKRFISFVRMNTLISNFIQEHTQLFEETNPDYFLDRRKDRMGQYGRYIFPTSTEGEISQAWSLLQGIDEADFSYSQHAIGYADDRNHQNNVDAFNKNVVNPFVNYINHFLSERIDKAQLQANNLPLTESFTNEFMNFIEPLADKANIDTELRKRCLALLSGKDKDATAWDSAVRSAGVVLENRMKQVGDSTKIGVSLANDLFGNNGSLASKFSVDAERQGYRDLYAGAIAAFRNPSAHRFIDPTPEEGGASIAFINLLLKKLDEIDK